MEPITFKFKFVNTSGHETGFFATQGTLTENELILGKETYPLGYIYRVIRRYSRLAIVYSSVNGPATMVIAPQGGMDARLKETIDRLCSYRWAEARHAQLVQEGKGAAYRTAKCRRCTATVDLTGFRETPQFYCPYCENILQSDYAVDERLDAYRLCDKCRFYCQPARFTAVYIILNVYSWREHHSCHVCMRRECWKMLAGNILPPFIGIIFATYHTIRAYYAGNLDATLPELVRANAYAQRGKIDQARELYEAMLERFPVQVGLRYDLAMAYAKAQEWEDCLVAAQRALEDCSNYQPAADVVYQALTHMGRGEEAEHFAKSWGMPEGQPAKPAATADSEHIQEGTPGGRSSKGIRE
jgi:tetratricopeptide (TPR) repeat protein